MMKESNLNGCDVDFVQQLFAILDSANRSTTYIVKDGKIYYDDRTEVARVVQKSN